MRRILTIAGLTLRSAVRSRVFALLAILVLGGIIGLPLIMKSDGSLAGQVRLLLEYTLGLTVALLSVMAVWAGAGAVALEVENRQFQLVAVKPVRALEVWIGKWLGLMLINAVLLAVAGAAIYGLLRWTTRPARLSAGDQVRLREEILVAGRDVLPAGRGTDPGLAAGAQPVAPGGTGRWEFNLPRAARAGEIFFLRYRFVASRPDLRSPVNGRWLIGAGGPSGQRACPVLGAGGREHALRITLPAGSRRLDTSYVNLEETPPVTLLFDAADSVKLRMHASRFEANYLRALLMVLARLAFFSALGLSCGAVFSFPVAVFVSLALLLLSSASRWVQAFLAGGAGLDLDGAQSGAILALGERLLRMGFQALNMLMPPLQRFDPLDFITGGAWISWGLTGRAWLILAGAYSGLLALAGAWWLSRRELGLPAD